jgi:hypothetical protein
MYDGAGAPNRSLQGSPRALASAGRRGGQRSILRGGVRWRFDGGGNGATGPRHVKTSVLGRKTGLGPFHGGAAIEGVEAKRCANDTCLAVAEPPGCLPSGRPRRRRLPGVTSAAVQAFRRLTATISSRGPTRKVKDQVPQRMTAKGPSYSSWSSGTAPPRQTQTRRVERSSADSSLGRWRLELELCLVKEKAGASNVI